MENMKKKCANFSGMWAFHHIPVCLISARWQGFYDQELYFFFIFAPSNWTVWITTLLPANLFSQILSCTHVLLNFWWISRYISSESWLWLSHRFSYLIHCKLMYKAIQEIIGDLQCLIDQSLPGKTSKKLPLGNMSVK